MSIQPLLSSLLPATAFDRQHLVSRGPLRQVIDDLERYLVREPDARPLLFDDASGRLIAWPPSVAAQDDENGGGQATWPEGDDPDRLAGRTAAELPQEEPAAGRRSGRPRLGVLAREVTLLPEQWNWLAAQPGGASAALRRLVDGAWQEEQHRDRRQRASAVAFHCLGVLGEGLAATDEALVAIHAGEMARFDQLTAEWPPDVRHYVRDLGFPGRAGEKAPA
ncbi:MAG: DUF2239 family protein [Pigmentiphaga sp.]